MRIYIVGLQYFIVYFLETYEVYSNGLILFNLLFLNIKIMNCEVTSQILLHFLRIRNSKIFTQQYNRHSK